MLGNQRDAWICCLGVMFRHIPYMLLWFAAIAAVGTEVAEDAEMVADFGVAVGADAAEDAAACTDSGCVCCGVWDARLSYHVMHVYQIRCDLLSCSGVW